MPTQATVGDNGLTMTPLHLGHLSPIEQVLVLLVAFGPFLLAAGVVLYLRATGTEEEDEGDSERSGA